MEILRTRNVEDLNSWREVKSQFLEENLSILQCARETRNNFLSKLYSNMLMKMLVNTEKKSVYNRENIQNSNFRKEKLMKPLHASCWK